jgi:hypothetical protein
MTIRKFAVVLAALLATSLVATMASPASATGVVQFKKFYYDSPGSDHGSSTSLNAEYFTVTNTGSSTHSLAGWTVRDRTGYKYTFPSGTSLRAGSSVKVHTGHGHDSSTNRYWNRSWYVWNNTGDGATLRTSSGTTSDTCSWSSVGHGYKNC